LNSLDEEAIQWTATRIVLNYKEPFKLPNVAAHTYLTWRTFVADFSGDLKKMLKRMDSAVPSDSNSKGHLKIPSMEVIHPTLHIGKGLEH
jgi:hypothetical protein